MATRYRIKRVTSQRNFGVLGDTVDTAKSATGKVLASTPVKAVGTIAGVAKGLTLGGIPGAIIGGIAGNALTKGLGNALQDN